MVSFVSAALLGAIKGTQGQGDSVACLKAQQNTSPQLPFSSPGQRTELSLIAGGLLGGRGASDRSKAHTNAGKDAEKMIYYRYNQKSFLCKSTIKASLKGSI